MLNCNFSDNLKEFQPKGNIIAYHISGRVLFKFFSFRLRTRNFQWPIIASRNLFKWKLLFHIYQQKFWLLLKTKMKFGLLNFQKPVRKKTLMKRCFSHYFDIEVGSNDNVTKITREIYTVFTTNMGRSKRKTTTWESISASIEIC